MKAIMRNKEEMKDSGIEWCERVPNSWCQIRLKDVYDFEKGKNAQIYTKDYIGLNQGIYPVYSGQTESGGIMGYINSYDYDLDECLFSTTVGAKVMTARILMGKFSLSQNCLIMNRCGDINNHFVFYMLHPLFEYEKSMIPTYMQPSLRIEDLKQYRFYAPILKEQQAIATYLDDRCSKIDTIIAEAKASIEEYKELKQAVIYEAVTKGLDKNVEMKDSGVEWIGKTPLDWQIIRVKHLLTEVNNRSVQGLEEPLSVSQVLGIVPSSEISVANPTSSYIGQKVVEQHDMVFNRLKAHLGVFFESNYKGLVSPDYAVFRGNKRINPKFLEYLFHTPAAITEFKKYITGVGDGLRRLYTDDLFNISVSIPSIEIQNEIISTLNLKVQKIDVLVSEKQSLIEDLESYKKSLIYEVVTGKRKVVE